MQKIKTEKFLIAGGNPTILVWSMPDGQRQKFIKNNLTNVDQIGFIVDKGLEMMGKELCINATLAYASTLKSSGFLNIEALEEPVNYKNRADQTTLALPIKYTVQKNIVILGGIGFKFENLDYKVTKAELKKLTEDFKLPAFGIILYENNQIFPYVYVKETDSLKPESACGSGSIATAILFKISEIKQPTKEIISVSIKNNFIEITSKVKNQKKGGV